MGKVGERRDEEPSKATLGSTKEGGPGRRCSWRMGFNQCLSVPSPIATWGHPIGKPGARGVMLALNTGPTPPQNTPVLGRG